MAAVSAHHINVDVFSASIIGVRGTQYPLSIGRERRCGKTSSFLAHDDGFLTLHIIDTPNFVVVLRIAAYTKELFAIDRIRRQAVTIIGHSAFFRIVAPNGVVIAIIAGKKDKSAVR